MVKNAAKQTGPRVVRTQRVTAPEVRYERRERNGSLVVEVTHPLPHGGSCKSHGAFWPIFLDAETGEPLCPIDLAPEMLSGAAVFEDRETAHRHVQALKDDRLIALHRIPTPQEQAVNRAMDLGGELPSCVGQFEQAYRNVLAAADAFRQREALRKVLAFIGVEEGDDLPLSGESVKLMTAEDVAALFSLDVSTIQRGNGRPSWLPAPIRLGRRNYWRSDVIANLISRSQPRLAPIPEIPTAEEVAR